MAEQTGRNTAGSRMCRIRAYSIVFMFVFVVFFFFCPVYSLSEGSEVLIDCSGNPARYRKAVAELNLSASARNGQMRGSQSPEFPLVLVLAKLSSGTIDQNSFSQDVTPEIIIQGPGGRYTCGFLSEEIAEQAVSELYAQENIVYAELDTEITACEEPEASGNSEEDPISFHSHGAAKMGFSPFLTWAGHCRLSSVNVAVIDSGLAAHPFLSGRVSGYGFDYVDVDDDPTNDLSGHGTHVAGIIVDCTRNLPVTLYPIRILDAYGNGKISNLINAIQEARESGVRLINLSLVSGTESEALHDEIQTAVRSGICVVVAAGNQGNDVSAYCPAHISDSGVIVVGNAAGSASAWGRASGSNYGSAVDVYAFGTGISSCSSDGGYAERSGTSSAAPHVTGACAGILAIHPGLSPQALESKIRTAAPTGLLNLVNITPIHMGCSLRQIMLDTDNVLPLPLIAAPLSCREEITWTSSDEELMHVNETGLLYPVHPGTAELVGSCPGLPEMRVQVTVIENTGGIIALPPVRTIQEEAFRGDLSVRKINLSGQTETIGENAFADCDSLQTVRIGSGCPVIAENAFDGDDFAVLLVSRLSPLAESLPASAWQYIITDE